MNDIRYAWRKLLKNPLITTVAALSLAIGIGANSAVFSMLYAIILSPLPFEHPERIMILHSTIKGSLSSVSGADFLDWRSQNRSFEEMCAIQRNTKFFLSDEGDDPVVVQGWQVTTGFSEIFKIKMALGRGFLPEDGKAGQNRVVLLSYGLWKSRFGGDSNLVGRSIMINEEPHRVIGIAPQSLGFIDESSQIFKPLVDDELKNNRGSHYLLVAGLLKEGVTHTQAVADMNMIADRLATQYVDTNANWGVSMETVQNAIVQSLSTIFSVLYGAVGMVLLMVCGNVANLLLANAGGRHQEIAIRCALGAGRRRILRQMLTESVLLALAGGVAGLFLTWVGLDALRLLAPKIGGTTVMRFENVQINWAVVWFTLGLSVLTGLIFGAAPAWQAARVDLQEALKQNGKSLSSGARRHRLLHLFVTTEVAMAIVLLIGAGLLTQNLYRLRNSHPGFDPSKTLVVELELPPREHYAQEEARLSFFRAVLAEMKTIPGATSVSAINIHPLDTYNSNWAITIQGHPPLPRGEFIGAEYRTIDTHYFTTTRIPLQQGRFFNSQDNGRHRVLIVNEAFVRKHLAGENPLGKIVVISGDDTRPLEIIGVVGNTKSYSLADQEPPPTMFQPLDQHCWHRMFLLARSNQDPAKLIPEVRSALARVNPRQPLTRIKTMDSFVQDTLSIQRFSAQLLGGMAGLALLLAAMGIYGVMAYSVGERTQEFGIRMALGAQSQDVIRQVLHNGMKQVGLGLAIGLAGALAIRKIMQGLLINASSTDFWTLSVMVLVLLGVALLACYLPARRAVRIDPVNALRYQ